MISNEPSDLRIKAGGRVLRSSSPSNPLLSLLKTSRHLKVLRMGYYRAPSATPSVGSDAGIPETLQDDPPKPQVSPGVREGQLSEAFPDAEHPATKRYEDKEETWVIFVGNLHPRVEATDVYGLFDGRDKITNIIVRTTRGCGVTTIPDEAITPSDRCYASVEFTEHAPAQRALDRYNPKNPPIVRGLPIIIAASAADMPEVGEILKRTARPPPETKTKTDTKERVTKERVTKGRVTKGRVTKGKVTRGGVTKRGAIKRGISRRVAVQETELVIEDRPRTLAGPSKRSAQ
ncbi:hypothetical protein BDM02DRAFT_3109567 [Thelephora ganbajun]|uniref:Uncharacterized protein n=1 Tax=Thelephora ganbajun TaxID=370292 RepID=A0ACB6ZRI3_THEGA|nr:hypothetical protein BDM02DRAFT_3109567 [Thelephora ganbajun]